MDWGGLTLDKDKMISSEYGGCVVPFYQCNLSILDLRLPFNNFEMEVLNHLMISHSQLNLVSWTYIKVFQYWCEYRGEKTSISLFFHLFIVKCDSINHALGQSLIKLMHFENRFFLVVTLHKEAYASICSIRIDRQTCVLVYFISTRTRDNY